MCKHESKLPCFRRKITSGHFFKYYFRNALLLFYDKHYEMFTINYYFSIKSG